MEELEKLKKKTKKIGITVMILFIIIAFILIFFEQIYDLHKNNGECYRYSATYEKEIFNQKFLRYTGKRIDYGIAKQCILSVRANNGIEYNNHIIVCKTNVIDLEKQKTYTIDCGYDNDGYINLITITEEGE